MLFLRLRPPPPSAAAPQTRASTSRTPLPLVPAQALHALDHGRARFLLVPTDVSVASLASLNFLRSMGAVTLPIALVDANVG